MMKFLNILLVAASIQQVVSLSKTSRIPVTVNLKRVIPPDAKDGAFNATTLVEERYREARSHPLLFQQILGLTAGSDFDFNLEKWRSLQASGLFRSLTAKPVTREDGGVGLHIEGIENPSIRFSPEIGLGGSLEEPQISGGVSVVLFCCSSLHLRCLYFAISFFLVFISRSKFSWFW
jgi:hypothetical protein